MIALYFYSLIAAICFVCLALLGSGAFTKKFFLHAMLASILWPVTLIAFFLLG